MMVNIELPAEIENAVRQKLPYVAVIADDFAVLRRFRRNCSLATYLTVIARRVIVRYGVDQMVTDAQRR